MDCSLARLLCPWNSPGQNTGVGSCSLLQGIFPTQRSNPDLQNGRQILYQLSHPPGKYTLLNFFISEVAQSCPTLCDPVGCSLPGFSIHGIFQARILEWITMSFSRGSSWPRDWTQVSALQADSTVWATREFHWSLYIFVLVLNGIVFSCLLVCHPC